VGGSEVAAGGPVTDPAHSIAFLGLGHMGLPMSQSLARAGYSVRAWNRSDRAGCEPADTDYVLAASAAQATAGASTVITMLPDLREVREVCEGPDGALAAAAPGAIVVVMGTVSPVEMRCWAQQLDGYRVIDAPVSGGPQGAREASLSIMVGGADFDVAEVLGPLRAMGSVVRHVGPVGAGQLAKACNQIVVAATLAALGEAITLGVRGGLAVEVLLDVLAGGLAGSRALEAKRDLLVANDFPAGGAAAFQHKDLGFALDAARSGSVALPVTAITDQLFGAMRATGRGGDDHSGVVAIIEVLSGATP
jgi:2-hydroxy-3-oxopropionate reductase